MLTVTSDRELKVHVINYSKISVRIKKIELRFVAQNGGGYIPYGEKSIITDKVVNSGEMLSFQVCQPKGMSEYLPVLVKMHTLTYSRWPITRTLKSSEYIGSILN